MKEIIKSFIDLLYPKPATCYVCGKKGQGVLCPSCTGAVAFIEGRTCLRCGKGLSEHYEGSYCPDCAASQYAFAGAFACFDYAETGKQLLHRLKYEGEKGIAPVLAKWMHERIKQEQLQVQAVVPVPMHESKLAARGYNQSQLIAETLGRLMRVPVADCLLRNRETKEQFGLDKLQRILNIDGAFSIKFGYNVDKYQCVLLVDDIYTTGSTANECSRALLKAGAKKVYVIAAASGSNT